MTTTDRSDRYLPRDWTLPVINPYNEAFFRGGGRGELRLQRCTSCSTVQHPPGEVCRSCQAADFDDVAVRPTGTVVSYSIVHHAVHPALRSTVPYNVAVVALDEHPDVRIVGNVVDVAPADLHVGLAVACTWAEVAAPDGDGIFLPQWRRSAS
jgi:uncharacterized OB-fold protein